MLSTSFLRQFQCTGPACPDTCCRGWNMQLDPAMREKYARQKPELLDAVAEMEPGAYIMKRDERADYCVKFEDGLCGIHKTYGTDFLGDACHFYPRVTRALGAQTLMTATPSCPEVVRLALFADDTMKLDNVPDGRVPFSLKDYLPPELTPEQALAVHTAFIDTAGGSSLSPAHAFARISSVARSLKMLPVKMWPDAVPFYLQSADARLPAAEPKAEDPFNLLHAACGLIAATRKTPSARLKQTIADMESALCATLDWSDVAIALSAESAQAGAHITEIMRAQAEWLDLLMRRWLQLQLSVALFPFAGLGANTEERITLIGVRYATTRLALACAYKQKGMLLESEEIIRIVQSLSRALDHLADPSFSLQVYQETGWTSEARLRGLITVQ